MKRQRGRDTERERPREVKCQILEHVKPISNPGSREAERVDPWVSLASCSLQIGEPVVWRGPHLMNKVEMVRSETTDISKWTWPPGSLNIPPSLPVTGHAWHTYPKLLHPSLRKPAISVTWPFLLLCFPPGLLAQASSLGLQLLSPLLPYLTWPRSL